MNDFQLKYDNLDILSFNQAMNDPASGAHVIFTGTVRDQSNNKEVISLEFEAYEPMAILELGKISAEIREKWKVKQIVLHHRLGNVRVGEIPVIAMVSSAHRAEAFEACTYLMNRLKETVPIWKKEVFNDGSYWVTPNP